MKNETLTYSL